MKFVLLIQLFLISIVLSACAPSETTKVGKFDPNEVQIYCTSECPDAVGVLIFVKSIPGGYSLARCTATLYNNQHRVITNGHCDDDTPNFDAAYFITPRRGKPFVSQVSTQVYDFKAGTSGLDRDIAIYELVTPVPSTPKSIARKIPSRMDNLITYVVNQTYFSSGFNSLRIDREECSTMPTMPLFHGGASEKKIGLALFGCSVIPGNSGSAVYSPEAPDQIQALINTLWNLSHGSNDLDGLARRLSERLKGLFFSWPDIFTRPYGMAERIHCLPVPGEAAPSEICLRLDMNLDSGSLLRAAVGAQIEQWIEDRPADEDIQWTLDTYAGVFEKRFDYLSEPTMGVSLIPRPICRRSNMTEEVPSFEISGLQLRTGFDQQGQGTTEPIGARKWRFDFYRRSDIQWEIARSESATDSFSFSASHFKPAANSRSDYAANIILADLPPCGLGAKNLAHIAAQSSLQRLQLNESELLEGISASSLYSAGAALSTSVKSRF